MIVLEGVVKNGPADPLENRPLVSPKGWAGERVGVGMVLVAGIPLIENTNEIEMFKFLQLRKN